LLSSSSSLLSPSDYSGVLNRRLFLFSKKRRHDELVSAAPSALFLSSLSASYQFPNIYICLSERCTLTADLNILPLISREADASATPSLPTYRSGFAAVFYLSRLGRPYRKYFRSLPQTRSPNIFKNCFAVYLEVAAASFLNLASSGQKSRNLTMRLKAPSYAVGLMPAFFRNAS
jgi:hypothetical protein